MQVFDAPLTTNDANLDRVLRVGLPTMLVFLNGPAAPDLDAALKGVARQNAGQILAVKLHAPESPVAAKRYEVSILPAVVDVRADQVLGKQQGISAADLEKHAAFLLGRGPLPRPEPAAAPRAPSASGDGASAGGGSADGKPIVITDASFEQVVMRSPQPVLVDFWAPWCGPCRMVAPVVEKLARESAGRLRVTKMNVDENPQIAARHNIQSIPTMMVVQNGQIVERWAGALPESAMRARLARWL